MLALSILSTLAVGASVVAASPTGTIVEKIPGVQYASHVKAFLPARSRNSDNGAQDGPLMNLALASSASAVPAGTGLCANVAQKKGKLLYWGGPVIKNVEVSRRGVKNKQTNKQRFNNIL